MILITGSTGFLGNALSRRIVDDDLSGGVVAAVRNERLSCSPGVHQIEVGDLTPTTDWSTSLLQVTDVVHCAARVHVMRETIADPLRLFRFVNVEGTLNLARQAAAAGVRRFVFISSVKVNGESTSVGKPFTEADVPNPEDAYGQSKLEAEQGLRNIAANSSMEVTIIRPPLIYGPNVKANFALLMRAVQAGWLLPLGAVQNKRSLVSLDNLVDFIVTCLTDSRAGNQTFMVSDGDDLSTPELVCGIAKAAGVSAHLLPIPVWALQFGAGLLGKGDAIQRLCGNLQIDISKARSLIDWVPPVSVEEGLIRAIMK